MPRFFDDYSNTYLTHDSAAGRKQQRRGWKFRENFKLHYNDRIQDWRKGSMGLASAQQAYVRARGKEDPMIPPLPDGWVEDVDEVTSMTFYSNEETGERTWVRPGFIPPPPPGRGGGGFRSRSHHPNFHNNRGPPQNFGNRQQHHQPQHHQPQQQQFGAAPPRHHHVPPPHHAQHHQPPRFGAGPPPPPNMAQGPPPPPPFMQQAGPPPPFMGGPPPTGMPPQHGGYRPHP